ncbi:alpha-L-fucosidase [uncultured Kriegella sp.]|uniref:alpha-L-fucosidase n=1 Tax=uncultured Kriegella sp. TaxID=1798910 RepID=UPI0030D97AFF|tara:strand:+ start:26763 stop:28268 length:1506 start_codon:yes stop_codon:yes gene_type:complete
MKFISQHYLLIVLLGLLFSCNDSENKLNKSNIELAKPSAKQLAFADWEVGAFLHFGLNVFTGQEHGDGKESPQQFNPTELDAEQWVLAAKALGAKYACLTVRHEGGFCLWPSKTTDYTIANSPYKNGNGDIAREFVDACRKHDMKIGFYHTSSHDAHAGLSWYDGYIGWADNRDSLMNIAFKRPGLKERYKQVQQEQMRELLTDYGPIDFMWSDHWGAPGTEDIWNPITDLVADLQPNMVFMGPETWVPGNESGLVVYPMWNAVSTIDGTNYSRPAANSKDASVENDYGLLETEVRTGNPYGKFWRVRECTTHWAFHEGGWFWHPEVTLPRSLSEHVDLYYRTVGLGANTIINLPPDNRGLIPDTIVTAAKMFGDEIKKRFSYPIAECDSVKKGNVIELKWENTKTINTVVLMENIANGQRIAKYTLEAFVEGFWVVLEPVNHFSIADPPYNPNPGYETIGHKKIDRVVSVKTNRLRFRCLKSVVGVPEIRKMQVFNIDHF